MQEKQFTEIFDSITIPEAFIDWAIKWLKDKCEEATVKREAIRIQQQRRNRRRYKKSAFEAEK